MVFLYKIQLEYKIVLGNMIQLEHIGQLVMLELQPHLLCSSLVDNDKLSAMLENT